VQKEEQQQHQVVRLKNENTFQEVGEVKLENCYLERNPEVVIKQLDEKEVEGLVKVLVEEWVEVWMRTNLT
jgi:hypothetical protein